MRTAAIALVLLMAIGLAAAYLALRSGVEEQLQLVRSCDANYVGVSADISNQLHVVRSGGESFCGERGDADEVVACQLARMARLPNPEAPSLPAYVGPAELVAAGGELVPCQVLLEPVDVSVVRVSQRASADAESMRSFRITLE